MSAPASEPIIYPPAFAESVVRVWNTLEDQPSQLPSVGCVAKILDVLYQASFLHEEGEAVRCRLILADPADWKQGEGPPSGFHVLRFAESRSFTPQEIRKLAPAASYYRSILGVHYDSEHGVSIWGIVETGTRWVNRVDGGRFDGAPLPPHLVVHILAAGHLLTACGYRRLLELSGGKVLKTGFDPFRSAWLPLHFRQVREWLMMTPLALRHIRCWERITDIGCYGLFLHRLFCWSTSIRSRFTSVRPPARGLPQSSVTDGVAESDILRSLDCCSPTSITSAPSTLEFPLRHH